MKRTRKATSRPPSDDGHKLTIFDWVERSLQASSPDLSTAAIRDHQKAARPSSLTWARSSLGVRSAKSRSGNWSGPGAPGFGTLAERRRRNCAWLHTIPDKLNGPKIQHSSTNRSRHMNQSQFFSVGNHLEPAWPKEVKNIAPFMLSPDLKERLLTPAGGNPMFIFFLN